MLDESVSWLVRLESEGVKVVDMVTFRRVPQEEAYLQVGYRFEGAKLEWTTK